MNARPLRSRLACALRGAAPVAVAIALHGGHAAAASTAAPVAATAASGAASSASEAATLPPVDAGPGLRHDPFRRPRIGPDGVVTVREPAEARERAPAVVEPPPWQPGLRGVMLAGADSIANVDGTILRLGETIDGWRLLRVDDGRATFTKSGRQTTLTMNNAGQARP